MISDKVQNNSNDQVHNNSVGLDQENGKTVEKISEQVVPIDLKDEKILQLETELLKLKEDERNNCLRLRAEIENVRRRSEQDIEKAHKFALEHFFVELLPVIDNLERALNMIDKSNDLFLGTIEGIELTLKVLLDTVDKFGLKIINEVNVPFDPSVYQAMSIIESEQHQSNYVIEVIQKGYLLNGRLIRPAMVTVSK